MQHLEPKIDRDRIYTPDDIAELFHVAPGTIRRLCRQGSMPCFYVGSHPRLMGTDLLAFINSGGARIEWAPGETPEPDELDQPDAPTKINSDAPALAEPVAA